MRLHLPKALLAAVLAAGFLAFSSSAQADTPAYSGGIYTWCNTGTTTADIAYGAWALSTLGEDGSYAYGDSITNWNTDGSTKIQDLFAPASTNTSDRNTLRFDSSKGSNRSIEFTFSPLNIAGIIVETGATDYGIASGGTQANVRSIYIGNNNTTTAAYSTIHEDFSIRNTASSNDNTGIFLRGTQTISIDSGKTLSLYAGKAGISISGSLTLTSGGTLALTGATTNNGALNIGSNVLLKVSKSINNTGSITFDSGAIIVLDQLLATSNFTTEATTTGAHTANGAFTFATGDGTVSVGDTLSCTYNGVTANVTWNDGHKTGTASVPYYFIAENDTATYAAASADTPAWITVSAGATLSDLPNDTDNSRTSNVGINIKGSGTLSMSTTTGQQQVTINAGRLEEFTGSLLIEKGRFNERNGDHVFSNVTVQNGGQFFIEDSCNYNGNVSIAGTGWNGSSDQAATGALRLSRGAVLSGTLTLASDANVRVHTGTGSISSSLDSNYILTKVGGGTLLLSGPSIALKGITVSDGSLYLGGNHDNKGTVTEVTAVALDSLTIQQGKSVTANYMKGTITSVELAGGTFNYRDCYAKNDANALNITTMTVSANSSFTRTWKGIVNVSELTGTGNIAISNINTQQSTDVVNLNVTMLKDYTGTISSSTDKVALKISSVSQSADKQGTISSAATLADGFTKTGDGAIEFSGNVDANGATILEGTLSFGGNVKITSGKSIVVSSDQGVSLTHDGFTYNGTTITTPTAANALSLFNNATVTNGTLTQTANANDTEKYKDIGATLSNVKLVNISTVTTWLTANDTLSALDIAGTLVVKSDTSVSGVATVSGTLEVDSGKSLKLTGQDTTSSITTLTGSGTMKTTGGKTKVTTATGFTGTLAATGGDIELQSATALALNEVVVAGGSSITVVDTVTDVLSMSASKVSIGAGAAGSLVGNLSIKDNGTITLDASAGITGTGLALGTSTTGSLTLGRGVTLNLINLGVLKEGESLTLFTGVTDFIYSGATSVAALSDDDVSTNTVSVDASEIFGNVDPGFFTLNYDGSNVILTASTNVPEPTTATLSLLALMGLAARRRRRKA